jgi:hypothetical protein
LSTFLKRFAVLLLLIFAGAVIGARGQGVGVPPVGSAAAKEIGLAEYVSELDRCTQALDRGAGDPAALRGLRDTLPSAWKVREGRVSYSVDTAWLTDALAGIAINPGKQKERLTATRQRLAALRESARALEAQDLQGKTQRDGGEKAERAKLDKILSAKEFQQAQGPSWFDAMKARFYDWLYRQLDKLHIPHSGAIGNGIAWLVILLAVALVAVWAVRSFVRGRTADIDLRNAAAPGRDWRYWLREARAAAERHDYRAAIHAAYWAGVSRMEEASLLPEDRSRTPRESLRLVRRESSEYAPLAALTRSFELVWYGYRAATETEWNEAMQQLEQLENARVPRPA